MLFPRPLANFRSPEGLLSSLPLIRAKIEPYFCDSNWGKGNEVILKAER